ncbi:MAG: metal-dependent hydrolase [Magnetospirillum sp.]|nr:metal-dependent hydrolase [Magnetospirillum sp.]
MSNLTVRSPNIDVAAMDMPLRWLGGDAFRTQVFNALSLSFPIGERYFIDAVRAALPLIGDAELAEDVRRFIGQEATHSHLHRVFNARLADQGLRNRVEPAAARRIRATEGFRLTSKLAVSAAYEHFTAAFGDIVLRHSDWLDGASAPTRALWMWHAVEECEHRSVIFDVYRAAGGGYWRRIGWFLYVTLVFALDVAVQTVDGLYRSGDAFKAATWRQGLRFLFGRSGVAARTIPAWLDYFRPGFSPRDRGDKEALRRWLEENRAWFERTA